jgi:cystathionine beta-lyase/cystathionine gamma-synthase
MKPPTQINHPPVVDLPADNRALVAPIYQSVKFEFDTVEGALGYFRGERPGFFYSRGSNPTTRQLELSLAQLQRRDDAIVCASGVGAMSTTLLSLAKQGDHVLSFIETYPPTRQLLRRMLGKFGVRHSLLSLSDLAGVERLLREQPTLAVAFESPTNPTQRIADIAALTQLARAHGALTVMDNTFAGPHQHGEFDVDLFTHSLTKSVGGHGDVLGGAVIGRRELIERLHPDFTLIGGTLDPHAAFLIQRGLKTYLLRYRAQSASARRIAEWLMSSSAVARVHYPGLPEHPGHALAAKQMQDFGAVVSFDLNGGAEAGRRFAEALKLFATAASLGATESLVLPPQMLGHQDLTPEQRVAAGLASGTVRLSIGLEDVDDLIADLQQALSAC